MPLNNEVTITKGEPFALANGFLVHPDGSVMNPNQTQAVAELDTIMDDPFEHAESRLIRTLADVRHEPNKMNVLMLVASYDMWGLSSHAIAHLMGVQIEQVDALLESSDVQSIRQQILAAIRDAENATVQGYMQTNAYKAAKTIVEGLNHASIDVKMNAAQDVLNRTGFRPVDKVEHTHEHNGGMRIVYIDEKATPELTIGINDE